MGVVRDADGLTRKQRLFVYEFIKDRDPRQAMVRAGYNPEMARHKGAELLRKPAVAAAVEKQLKKVEGIALVDAARVLEELARVALADPRRLFDAHGNLKPITEWDRDSAACVAGVEVVKRNLTSGDGHLDTVIKIKMWDKPKGLELLAKHFGMLTEKIEVKGDADLVARLAGARQRVLRVAAQSTAEGLAVAVEDSEGAGVDP